MRKLNPTESLFVLRLRSSETHRVHDVCLSNNFIDLNRLLQEEYVEAEPKSHFKKGGCLEAYFPMFDGDTEVGVKPLGTYEAHVERHKKNWRDMLDKTPDISEISGKIVALRTSIGGKT